MMYHARSTVHNTAINSTLFVDNLKKRINGVTASHTCGALCPDTCAQGSCPVYQSPPVLLRNEFVRLVLNDDAKTAADDHWNADKSILGSLRAATNLVHVPVTSQRTYQRSEDILLVSIVE